MNHDIKDNLAAVKGQLAEACRKAGRPENEVFLIAVSKTKPASAIEKAYAAGQRAFGENKAQEITAKKPLLPQDIAWHFIGNLQRNKVKYLVGEVALIHSVSSEGVLLEIERIAERRGVMQDILIEVNVAGEESKQGADEKTARELVIRAADCPHVRLRGLMTVAPLTDDPETVRPWFARLKELLSEWRGLVREPALFSELSMGMSGDYEAAIEEGATFVRIGTAIFGARN